MPKSDSWETEESEEQVTDTDTKYNALEIGEDLIEDLPPAGGSLYQEAIGKLVELSEEGDGWLRLSTGGRKANSVQTGLQTAAANLGVDIKTRTRTIEGEKFVFVALDHEEDEEEDDSEE